MTQRIELAPPRKVPWQGLAALLLVALVLRLCVILAPPDQLFERGAIPHEELLRGVATKEFLDGPLLPIQDYQVNHFWGGSLVVSFLAVPFFQVLGPSIVALRLTSLLFSLSCVLLAFCLLDRYANRRAAWFAAALLAIPPPGYTFISCTVYGTHLESNALALGLCWLYLRWRERGRGGIVRTLLFGVCSGFALWFGYGLLVVLLCCAAFELIADKLCFTRRWFALYALGFLVGFAPWLYYGWSHRFTPLDVYDISIAEHFAVGLERGSSPRKLFDFVVRDWPESFWLHGAPGIERVYLGRLVALLLLVLAAISAWSMRASLRVMARSALRVRTAIAPDAGSFALVFTVAFALTYCLSDFEIGPRHWVQNFRYLMPLWPFMACLAGLTLANWYERHAWGTRAVALGAFGLFAVTTLAQCDRTRVRSNWNTPGHSFEYLVRFTVQQHGARAGEFQAIVRRLRARRDAEERERLLSAFGMALRVMAERKVNNADDEARRSAFDATFRAVRDMLDESERRAFLAKVAETPQILRSP